MPGMRYTSGDQMLNVASIYVVFFYMYNIIYIYQIGRPECVAMRRARHALNLVQTKAGGRDDHIFASEMIVAW